MTKACADCEQSDTNESALLASGLDHVHKVPALPEAEEADGSRTVHGFAVGMSAERVGQQWTFFEHIEPALAFGRSGRSSALVLGYGVYAAALATRFDDTPDQNPRALYVSGPALDRADTATESRHLRAWVDGVLARPDAPGWTPPS